MRKINKSKRRYAIFGYDKDANIVGLCNDSFRMSYRNHCVHIWEVPPDRYINRNYNFIVCTTRKYNDLEILPCIRVNHTFKGNYIFKQKVPESGEFLTFTDTGDRRIISIKNARDILIDIKRLN